MLTATSARRAAVVAGLFSALIIGTGFPASAAFDASSRVSTTVTTVVVAAPTSVTVNGRCTGGNYSATISWPASTTATGVTGYSVVAYLNNGTTSPLGTTDAATLSLAVSSSSSNLSTYQPRITVTTLTSYGWSAESLPSAVLTC